MTGARVSVVVVALWLAACASGPPVPDWQLSAKSSLDRAVAAWLAGDTRVATLEADRARSDIGRTARVDLVARAELILCAARVASLVFEPCDRFEAVRADAPAAEQAYADYLAGRFDPGTRDRLPKSQRAVAAKAASGGGAASVVKGIEDPLARLVAAGVLFRAGQGEPALVALAVDTASEQGWRRPLLAWLGVQRSLAEKAGAAAEAARIQRRIELIPP